jgi:hypothetical protein
MVARKLMDGFAAVAETTASKSENATLKKYLCTCFLIISPTV